ncbi:DUF2092 domain-containing protein [Streptomyces sp. SL13]|uniref:DUF2092 domain-containing protein n=1 Tax=Streptantibioticus silvisoli TaxID=2705255 RepID=A0AA90KI78_9ACTN|nr:DUF2092 domain-containing protein [Streptantibioticus silvisoli]MDI5972314.1 DUF2092 domain-containing protein [Streptantibioticus silvisoli]
MPGIQPPRPEDDFGGYAAFDGEDERRRRNRKVARYAVPVAIAGLAAATIGLGTALATTGGGPSLPKLTPAQLIAKMASARAETVSGSVRVNADLGLPAGLLGSGAAGALGGGSGPASHLTELLFGTHTLRVAADGPTRERLSLGDAGSQYSVVRDGSQLWTYDSADHSVQHATGLSTTGHGAPATVPATPADAASQVLKALAPTTAVTVDGSAEVAGQAAYELVLTPKQSGSTVGSVRVAVDAANGVPLSFTVLPAGGGGPIVDIAWTQVDFARPAASEFDFTVPKGAHVTQAKPGADHARTGQVIPGMPGAFAGGKGSAAHGKQAGTVIGKGWTSVAELRVPAAALNGKAPKNGKSTGGQSPNALLGTLGKPVKGAFGSGTVISTRLVNVLVTDNGGVYAGAVTPSALVKAADAAK